MNVLIRYFVVAFFLLSFQLSANTIIQDASSAWKEAIRKKKEAEKLFSEGSFDEAKTALDASLKKFSFLREEYPAWRTGLVQVNFKQISELSEKFIYFSNLKLEAMGKDELLTFVVRLRHSYDKLQKNHLELLELASTNLEALEYNSFRETELKALEESLLELKSDKKSLEQLLASSEVKSQQLDKRSEEIITNILRERKNKYVQENLLEFERNKLQDQISGMDENLFKIRKLNIQLENKIAQLNKRIEGLDKNNKSLLVKLENAEDLVSLSKLKKNSEAERKTLLSKIVQLQEEKTRLNISNSALRENLNELKSDAKVLADIKSALQKAQTDREKFLASNEKLQRELKKEQAKTQVLTEKLNEKSNSVKTTFTVSDVAKDEVIQDLQDEILKLKSGDLTDANTLVAMPSKLSQQDLDELQKMIDTKDREGFSQKLSNLMSYSPEDFKLWHLKAVEAYQFQEFKNAYNASRKAIQLNPKNVSALELGSKITFRLNKNYESLEYASKLLTIDSENFLYHQSLALAMNKLGFKSAAEKSLLKAHELNKNSKLIVYNLCLLISKDKNRKDDASVWYDKYLELGGKKVAQLEKFFNRGK